MKNRIILLALLILTLTLAVGSVAASDINNTDSYSALSNDDNLLSVSADRDDLEYGNSNTLSINPEDDSLSSGNDVDNLSTSDSEDSLSDTSPSSTITSKNLTKYYKGNAPFTATFLDSQGNPLANKSVAFQIVGKTYNRTTNANGVASLAINLKPGTYNITTKIWETGESANNVVKVLSTISAKNVSKVYTDLKTFQATFYKNDGSVLANTNVKFKINGKTYTQKTNSKGVASLSMVNLPKGTYKIISYNLKDGLKKTNTVKVVTKCSSKLISSSYTFLTSESKTIKVTLHNQFNYAPGAGKTVKFTINGKTYSASTNSKGVASLKLPSLAKGVYTVKYAFAGNIYYKASSASNTVTIVPSKSTKLAVSGDTTFGSLSGTPLKVKLTAGDVPLAGKTVNLKLNDKVDYTRVTDKDGIVSLPINLNAGNYNIVSSFAGDSFFNAASRNSSISVVDRGATSLSWQSATTLTSGTNSVKVLLTDKDNKALSGKTVKLTVNSKTYSATTSSTGYATFSVSLTSAGTYKASMSFDGDNIYYASSASTSLKVNSRYTSISIANIITSAKNLQTYYTTNKKLPGTVNCAGSTFTTAEFLYLMSEAIVNLGNSKNSSVSAIKVSDPSSPSGDAINSKSLSKANYLTVAANVAKFIKQYQQAPNYASSSLGKIAYSALVDSFSKVLNYYSTNSALPSSVTIKYSQGSSIDELAARLTAGLTTDKAKANALFVWVRDNIAYSFYYNTVKGASGTLSSGTGNCCDQAQLLVALARSAGLTARFATGYCTFSSGTTYGHVWAQIYVDNAWHALDPTSSRNTYDKINNWNTASYTSRGVYTTLPY